MQEGKPFVTVLIPAAGRGTRMGGVRKQYRNLGDKPILVRTVELFADHPHVTAIVLAVPAGDRNATGRMMKEHGVGKIQEVVAGGDTRQASVSAALSAVPEQSDVVLVHDAVRPFVPADRIEAVIRAALRTGAAALAIPVVDTLRSVEEGSYRATIDRRGVYRMQTPQAFRLDWFAEAHRAAQEEGYHETDDVALVQRTGRDVTLVQGSTYNFKVTTPDDLALAQALWAAQLRAGDI